MTNGTPAQRNGSPLAIAAVMLVILPGYLAYGPMLWAFIVPASMSGPQAWVAWALVGGGAWQLLAGAGSLILGMTWMAKRRVMVGGLVFLLGLPLVVSGGYFLKSAYEQWESRQG